MEFIRQTVSGVALNNFIALPAALRNRNVQVIVLPAPDDVPAETPNYSCNIGFARGADVPDSFFEPLPEEDLLAWGL